MLKQTIYVAGYPKSGTTYLTRLLGDVLNSPTGGCMPSLDHTEIATEGQDRPGDYIIRKGHFTLIKDDSPEIVPYPHKLNYQRLTNEKIVFLVRDPRDICISGAYHWRQKPTEFLDRMINGDVAKCGRWDKYIKEWLDFHIDYGDNHYPSTMLLTYENLLSGPYASCKFTIEKFRLSFKEARAREAIKRQSFKRRQSLIHLENFDRTPEGSKRVEQELRRNNMRKGIVGDYKNYFTQEMNDRIWLEFGWIMERLGYVK